MNRKNVQRRWLLENANADPPCGHSVQRSHIFALTFLRRTCNRILLDIGLFNTPIAGADISSRTRSSAKMLCRICRLRGASSGALAASSVVEKAQTAASSAVTSRSSRSLSSVASSASLFFAGQSFVHRPAVGGRTARSFSTSGYRHAPGEKEVGDQDISTKPSAPADAIPWFMQSETITLDPSTAGEEDLVADEAAEEADGVPPEIILGHKSLLELLQEADESIYTIPEQLEDLYDLLTRGGPSGLVAKRQERPFPEPRFGEDPDDESSVPSEIIEPPSIRMIPASMISAASNSSAEGPAMTSDSNALGQSDSWCDWIVMVEARGSAAGTVKRLAQEIGAFVSPCLPLCDIQASVLKTIPFSSSERPLRLIQWTGLALSSTIFWERALPLVPPTLRR